MFAVKHSASVKLWLPKFRMTFIDTKQAVREIDLQTTNFIQYISVLTTMKKVIYGDSFQSYLETVNDSNTHYCRNSLETENSELKLQLERLNKEVTEKYESADTKVKDLLEQVFLFLSVKEKNLLFYLSYLCFTCVCI